MRCLTSRLPEQPAGSGKGRDVMTQLLVISNSLLLLGLLQESDSHFEDLGKLLLGGVIAAVVFAVAFTFVRLRLRDKQPRGSGFISISSVDEKK